MYVGSWGKISDADKEEGVNSEGSVSVYITIEPAEVERSGTSIMVPIPHDAATRPHWGDIMKAFNWTR